MSHLRIPFGKLVDNLTGATTEILLPGAQAGLGQEVYRPDLHGRKRLDADNRAAHKDDPTPIPGATKRYQLLCGGCRGSAESPGAEIHYHSLVKNRIGGMLEKDSSDHLHTNPKQQHINCIFREAARTSKKREYDQSKGFRLHFGLLPVSDTFNMPSLVHVDAAHRIVHHDPDTAMLEPCRINSAADVIDFIERTPSERLRQSKIIRKGYPPIDWQDFCIRRDDNGATGEPVASPRFIRLVETLMEHHHQASFPVFMQVSFIRPVTPCPGENEAIGISRSLYWGQSEAWQKLPGGGRMVTKSHHIQPKVVVKNGDSLAMQDAIPEAGTYFVLGHARLDTTESAAHFDHYLTIEITDPSQIIRCDIEDIVPAIRPRDGIEKKAAGLENRLA